MTRNRPNRRELGFTLMEVMVTLSMIGGIMTVIYTVLYTTLDQKRKIEVHVMASRVGPLLLDQVENDIRQLFTYNVNNGITFQGEDNRISGQDADTLRMVCQAPSTSAVFNGDRPVFAPVNEVGYVLTETAGSDELMTLWRREDYFVDDKPMKGGPGTPLYRRVLGFDVKYYDVTGEDAEEEDDWDMEDRENKFPAACKITLRIEVESRAMGEVVTRDEMDRREYTFHRYVTFPKDAARQMAVLPAIPTDPTGDDSTLGGSNNQDGEEGDGRGPTVDGGNGLINSGTGPGMGPGGGMGGGGGG